MTRGKQWSKDEIAKVWILKAEGKSQTAIAKEMGKTQAAVSIWLKRGQQFSPKKRTGRRKKTSPKTDRRILRLAYDGEKSLANITSIINNTVGMSEAIAKSTVRRRIVRSGIFKHKKMSKTISLKPEHKKKTNCMGKIPHAIE